MATSALSQPRPVRAIIREFAEAHGYSYADLIGHRRGPDIDRVRHAATAHVKTLHPRMSLRRLGHHFDRHQSTIRYLLRTAGMATGKEA